MKNTLEYLCENNPNFNSFLKQCLIEIDSYLEKIPIRYKIKLESDSMWHPLQKELYLKLPYIDLTQEELSMFLHFLEEQYLHTNKVLGNKLLLYEKKQLFRKRCYILTSSN